MATKKRAPKKASKPRNRAAQDATLINHRALSAKVDELTRTLHAHTSRLAGADRLAKTFDDRLRSAVVRLESVENNVGRLVRVQASKSAGNLVEKPMKAAHHHKFGPVAPPHEPDDNLNGALDTPETPTTPLNLAEQARDHGDNG